MEVNLGPEAEFSLETSGTAVVLTSDILQF